MSPRRRLRATLQMLLVRVRAQVLGLAMPPLVRVLLSRSKPHASVHFLRH